MFRHYPGMIAYLVGRDWDQIILQFNRASQTVEYYFPLLYPAPDQDLFLLTEERLMENE